MATSVQASRRERGAGASRFGVAHHKVLAGLIIVVVALTVPVLDASPADPLPLDSFSPIAAMPLAVTGAQSALLANGDVLVAGGLGSNGATTASTQVYSPLSGSWSSAGSMLLGREDAVTVTLPGGSVLVAGGLSVNGASRTALSEAELYDPATGTWTRTAAMPLARYDASAVLLEDGQVLVSGGFTSTTGSGSVTATSELYEPSTGVWHQAAPMPHAVAGAAATVLLSGDVLVAGGTGASGTPVATASLYRPPNGTWAATGSLPTAVAGATLTRLANGQVLLAGGRTTPSSSSVTADGQLYHPIPGAWTRTGSLPEAVTGAASALLADGDVLVAGGAGTSGAPVTAAALLSPADDRFASTGPLPAAVVSALAVAMGGGQVLVAGGRAPSGAGLAPSAAAEVYFGGLPATMGPPAPERFVVGATSSVTLSAGGAPAPSITERGALPLGLTFSAVPGGQATVSGTPLAGTSGSYPVSVSASNGVGPAVTRTLQISVGTAPAAGYWEVSSGDSVGAFGDTSTSRTPVVSPLVRPIVAAIATPDGGGYWVVTDRGNVFNEGDAGWYGSEARRHLVHPVVAAAASRDGRGYWLVTRSGQVFPFGDAEFLGSAAHDRLLSPVTAIAPTPDRGGYWLLTADGTVLEFGDAHSFGAAELNWHRDPAVSIAATPDGGGYWILTRQGRVYPFGDARFFGSPAASHRRHVVATALAAGPDGSGYYVLAANGSVFNYGDASFYGSTVHERVSGHVVAIALGAPQAPLG